ncbi:MAG: ribosome biogenesis GTPase A [Oceanicoccus sp.]|jgi:ribosome biogenesis GTPase A
MSIQWFPGHMYKARKEIEKIIVQVDLIIEVLDARIPYSSENPMIAKLRGNKPTIKVLTKSDLADPSITEQWLSFFEKENNVKARALSIEKPEYTRQLIDLIRAQLPEKEKSPKNINVMIMGIPNVGKSTLINILAGKSIAKTGNEPAVTKGQQRINLRNGIMLWDTPGMLWPKVENDNSSYRLATTGAIKDTAMSYEDVAFFGVDFLLKAYPNLLIKRYELDPLPSTEIEFLESVGQKRGCLVSGGRVDLEKISKIILSEFRSGVIGRISLETPSVMAKELIEVEEKIRIREEKKALKKLKKTN